MESNDANMFSRNARAQFKLKQVFDAMRELITPPETDQAIYRVRHQR